jgi:protein arginine kinase
MHEVKAVPAGNEFDAWFDIVLKQNARPHWLTSDGAESDVILSTRARVMRNLDGLPFPHRCNLAQLDEVQRLVRNAATPLIERRLVPDVERAILAGSRLVSVDFPWGARGRSVFVDPQRAVALMANEEDHLRIQAVLAGLDVEGASALANHVEAALGERLNFSWQANNGYLAASAPNAGTGARLGVMAHVPASRLIGLPDWGPEIEVRGFMGEVTTGLGAYLQVSSVSLGPRELAEVLEHLIEYERNRRGELDPRLLESKVQESQDRLSSREGTNLWDAVSCLSWLRLGSVFGKIERTPRELDTLLALLVIGPHDEPETNLRRTRLMSRFLELTLPWATS